MANLVTIETMHQGIISTLSHAFPSLTVEGYRYDRKSLPVPCCLIELTEIEPSLADDEGAGTLPVRLKFTAMLIIGFKSSIDPKMSIRSLAATMCQTIHQNRWGTTAYPAELESCYHDHFESSLDQFEVWSIDFQNLVFLGDSVWDDSGITPQIVFMSELGGQYNQVTP